MAPVEISKNADDAVAAAPVAKSVIGIIYPPPEVRNIVDKTASFVARNGQEFEARIRHNELNNPKFNFLAPNDPYHAYYRHKVKEFQEGRGQEPSNIKSGFGYMLQKPQAVEQIKLAEVVTPKEPPPEFEFIADPPSISAFDLDMVKTTAQFVARNGRQFLTTLMKMEARNYQFDFLRPQHSLFNYFTKLVEQYTKILIPPKDLLGKLKKEAETSKEVMDVVKYRMEWIKHQERERKREEEEKEKERVAYAQIDWHDFVVVETVDYQPTETGNLPPPTTPDEVGARLLQQQRFEDGPRTNDVEEIFNMNDRRAVSGEDNEIVEEHGDVEEDEEPLDDEDKVLTRRIPPPPSVPQPVQVTALAPQPAAGADTRVQDMEQDSDSDNEENVSTNKPPPPPPVPPIPKDSVSHKLPPLPPNPDQVLIRRDYNPKAPKSLEPTSSGDKFLISPITGEQIAADKIQEHMRIGLLDPKWIEQRDRALAEKREQEEVYAPGTAIGDQLKHLAERRTDIFGSGAEETQIGKKIGEEEKKEKAKIIWDGHSASMEKVSQKARENITIEDQIAVIHKVKGLAADDDKEKIGPAMPSRNAATQQVAPPPPVIPPPPPTSTVEPPAPPPPPGTSRPPLPKLPATAPPNIPPPPPPGSVSNVQPPPPPSMLSGANRTPLVMVRPPFIPGIPMAPMIPRPPVPTVQTSMAAVKTKLSDIGMDDEPLTKRARTEDQLIPEHDFLIINKGPVTFRVQVPNLADKTEWKLNGQSFTITLPLTDTVSVIKAKMFDELGMPSGKQKLQLDGMFMKDSNTLAFYNFSPMCVVQLQVKERGGRKK